MCRLMVRGLLLLPLAGAWPVMLPWRARARAGMEERTVSLRQDVNRSTFVSAISQFAAAAVVPSGVFPTRSWAETGFQDIVAGDGSFSFQCPERFEQFSKLLKTHAYEMNVKSTSQRGYVAGVAVDPVKLESLEKFGTPTQVGEAVVNVERTKEGVLNAELLNAGPVTLDGLTYYVLDYISESTRGNNHYLCRVAVRQGKLYVFTVQAKAALYPEVQSEANSIAASFRLL